MLYDILVEVKIVILELDKEVFMEGKNILDFIK